MLALLARGADERRDPNYQIFILWTKPERKPLFSRGDFAGTTFSLIRGVDRVLWPRARVVVVRPPFTTNPEDYDPMWQAIFSRSEHSKGRKTATVFVDEMNAVTHFKPNGGTYWLRRLWTEGGGLGIGVWSGVQDPVNLQREMLSQADHKLVFRVDRSVDRKKLSGEMGIDLPEYMPDPHGFYYRTHGKPPIYYPSIQAATGIERVWGVA